MSLATDATEAKRRVLAVHPKACIRSEIGLTGYGRIYILHSEGTRLAYGDSPDEAWIAAAAGLEERNER